VWCHGQRLRGGHALARLLVRSPAGLLACPRAEVRLLAALAPWHAACQFAAVQATLQALQNHRAVWKHNLKGSMPFQTMDEMQARCGTLQVRACIGAHAGLTNVVKTQTDFVRKLGKQIYV
jgi:hypothetical protein